MAPNQNTTQARIDKAIKDWKDFSKVFDDTALRVIGNSNKLSISCNPEQVHEFLKNLKKIGDSHSSSPFGFCLDKSKHYLLIPLDLQNFRSKLVLLIDASSLELFDNYKVNNAERSSVCMSASDLSGSKLIVFVQMTTEGMVLIILTDIIRIGVKLYVIHVMD